MIIYFGKTASSDARNEFWKNLCSRLFIAYDQNHLQRAVNETFLCCSLLSENRKLLSIFINFYTITIKYIYFHDVFLIIGRLFLNLIVIPLLELF